MNKFLFFIVLAGLSSCAALKPGHAENVRVFAQSARMVSAMPGELYKRLSAYRHQLRLVESSTIYTADKILPRLNKLLEFKQQFDQNAILVDQSVLLIASYAECLLALTDAAYYEQVKKHGADLSLKLNTAISSYNQVFQKKVPINVGSLIGNVVRSVGSMNLRQLQKKYLKNFVDSGALIVNVVCDYLIAGVNASLENELGSLDRQFANVMTTFYDNIYDYQKAQNVNPFDYLRYYNPLYLEMKERLTQLHSLQKQMNGCLQQVKEAHEKLRLLVNGPPPTDLTVEIKELYTATRQLQAAYQVLKD